MDNPLICDKCGGPKMTSIIAGDVNHPASGTWCPKCDVVHNFNGDINEARVVIAELTSQLEASKKDRYRLFGIVLETMIALQLPIPESSEDMVPSAARVTVKHYDKLRKIALAARRFIDSLPSDIDSDPWVEFLPSQMKTALKLRDIVGKEMPGPLSDHLRPGEEE